jgi:hypothetical protein
LSHPPSEGRLDGPPWPVPSFGPISERF